MDPLAAGCYFKIAPDARPVGVLTNSGTHWTLPFVMTARVCPLAAAPVVGPSPQQKPQLIPRQHKRTTSRHPRHAIRSRFSLDKLKQFRTYARSTSVWRHLAVILVFAVPSVLASFVAPLVPLNDPHKGLHENPTFFLLLFVTCMLTVTGTMPQVRAAAEIPHELYSNCDMVLVGLVSSVPLMGLGFIAATYWRFPVPFFWVLIAGPWLVCVMFGNAVVLWRRLGIVGRPLLAYMPSLAVQVAQIVIYPSYSAIFEASGDKAQIALILFFPILKYGLKKGIFALTRRTNRELSTEISVSAVEICSSMYQSIIMQTTPSFFAMALLIGVDVLQGLYAIRMFMQQGTALARTDVVATLVRLLDESHGSIIQTESELIPFGTRQAAVVPAPVVRAVQRMTRQRSSSMDTTAVAPATTEASLVKLGLTQALELLQTAETILLVEYLEVAVPMINAIYLAFATQFDSVQYNPRLRDFYQNPEALREAIASVVLYTTLQALTLVVMGVALQYRLKVSAWTLLAFVLETHAWSLQGKLVPWLSVFFVFPIVHFGVDFSFQFDFPSPVVG